MQEYSLLKEMNDVEILVFRNDNSWRGAIQFLFSIWNITAAAKTQTRIREFKPDIIHLHNWHYASGPIIIRTAKKMGIPVVSTQHNYRLLCPSGSLMNKSKVFTDSLTVDFPWTAIKLRVYRDSFIQTFWLSLIVWFHKRIGTWSMVSRYITLSKPALRLFSSSFLNCSPEKFITKPNFAETLQYIPVQRNDTFLYVGRLSDEKGVNILLSTFRHSRHKLLIAGDGPLSCQVEAASSEFENIRFLGSLDKTGVTQAMKTSNALLFPSIWYETFGMVIIEAFALGCPVIASNIGSPTELVQNGVNGLHFEAGNVGSLRLTLEFWTKLSEEEKEGYSKRARATYEQLYTPEANSKMLMDIYESVIDEAGQIGTIPQPVMSKSLLNT